ncbi:MAG: FG-GAP repeat protein [Gemmatimonadaceae bacterium]|nr:FG-GAP repeat protein [Gemmatimonadaceae bacterium]
MPGETLGFDATGIGDVNGDGLVDLLITSSWSNVNGFRSGRMYIVAGTR